MARICRKKTKETKLQEVTTLKFRSRRCIWKMHCWQAEEEYSTFDVTITMVTD